MITKAVIVYLSYTGNTLKIAQAIKSGIAPLVAQTDMVRLRQTDPKTLAQYDLIGIGSPVRLGKMPGELGAFTEGMDGLEESRARRSLPASCEGRRHWMGYPVVHHKEAATVQDRVSETWQSALSKFTRSLYGRKK